MADFIEVKQGIFVKADTIEAVIDISDDNNPEILCKVYTANNSYPSVLPSQIILDMLGVKEEPIQTSTEVQEQMLNIMKQETNVMGG